VRGGRPFQNDDIRDRAEPLDQRQRDAGAGPERVVDDDADIGRLRRGGHVFEEIFFRMVEVERARDLDEVAAALCAAFASNRSSRVLVVWAPIATGTLPAEAAATVSATILRSSKVMAEKSPAHRRPAARRSSR